jgi:predicted transposase/invertase (TIGR01784 family)
VIAPPATGGGSYHKFFCFAFSFLARLIFLLTLGWGCGIMGRGIDVQNNNFYDLPEILPFKEDHIFKSMLTKPEADIVRNSMISAFTGLNIVESAVAENEPPLDLTSDEKAIRLDVNCKTADGKKINIEMQAHAMAGDSFENNHESLRIRSMYYISRLFAAQNAKNYLDLNETIHIMVCGFNVFNDDLFIHKFRYADKNIIFNDICSIIYVELPKIKTVIDKPFDEMTPDERWAVFVQYADDEKFKKIAPAFESQAEFKVAMNMLAEFSQSEKDYYRSISRLKYAMDRNTEILNATNMGIKKGIDLGKAEGIKEGMQVGIQQGKKEALYETAVNLLKTGLPPSQVALGTNLPLSEIEILKANL